MTGKEKNEIEEKNVSVAQQGLSGLEAFASFQEKGAPIVGMDEVSAEDIKMPKIKLAQPTSAEVADEKCKAGQFYNVTTGEALDEVDCYILALGKSRVQWPEQFKRGDNPVCMSFDGKISEDGHKCSECDKCKWEGDKKPDCRQVYMWLGVLAKDKSPFRISMAGTAVSETKNYITEIVKHNLPFFVFKTKIKSEKQKGDQGIYYTPVYELCKNGDGTFETIAPTAFNDFKDLTESLSKMFFDARKKDLVDTEMAKDAGEGDEKLF